MSTTSGPPYGKDILDCGSLGECGPNSLSSSLQENLGIDISSAEIRKLICASFLAKTDDLAAGAVYAQGLCDKIGADGADDRRGGFSLAELEIADPQERVRAWANRYGKPSTGGRAAEWFGELQLRELVEVLGRPITVYSETNPPLTLAPGVGDSFCADGHLHASHAVQPGTPLEVWLHGDCHYQAVVPLGTRGTLDDSGSSSAPFTLAGKRRNKGKNKGRPRKRSNSPPPETPPEAHPADTKLAKVLPSEFDMGVFASVAIVAQTCMGLYTGQRFDSEVDYDPSGSDGEYAMKHDDGHIVDAAGDGFISCLARFVNHGFADAINCEFRSVSCTCSSTPSVTSGERAECAVIAPEGSPAHAPAARPAPFCSPLPSEPF